MSKKKKDVLEGALDLCREFDRKGAPGSPHIEASFYRMLDNWVDALYAKKRRKAKS